MSDCSEGARASEAARTGSRVSYPVSDHRVSTALRCSRGQKPDDVPYRSSMDFGSSVCRNRARSANGHARSGSRQRTASSRVRAKAVPVKLITLGLGEAAVMSGEAVESMKDASTFAGRRWAVSVAQRVTVSTSARGKVYVVSATAAGRSCSVTWKRVATAKNPGPAPRAAQKRSGFSLRLQVRASPFAVTTSTARTPAAAGP